MIRISINEGIEKIADIGKRQENFIKKLEKYNDGQHFAHFSDLEKFGINPKTRYNTPAGIYGYPISYIVEAIKTGRSSEFAFERKYIHIFRFKPGKKVLSFPGGFGGSDGQYSQEQLDEDIEKLRQKFKLFHNNINSLVTKTTTRGNYANKSPEAFIWAFTYFLLPVVEPLQPNIRSTILWTVMFRFLGIDGFIDEGNGLIHENEPYQTVAFGKTVIDHVAIIDNRISKQETNIEALLSHRIFPKIRTKEQLLTVYSAIKKQMNKNNQYDFIFNVINMLGHAVERNIDYVIESMFDDIMGIVASYSEKESSSYYAYTSGLDVLFLFPTSLLNKYKEFITTFLVAAEQNTQISREILRKESYGVSSPQNKVILKNLFAFVSDKICPEQMKELEALLPDKINKFSLALRTTMLFNAFIDCNKKEITPPQKEPYKSQWPDN